MSAQVGPDGVRPPLFGRDGEWAVLRDVLDSAAGEVAAAATIEGEAGMGKSELLERVVDDARERGWTVLVARPAEAETALSWATLADLLQLVPDNILGRLPEPQLRAIDSILLRHDSGLVDPRAVATTLATVIRNVAGAGPALIAIDDVQWVDAASAGALAFALRRLPVGIAVVVAERATPGGSAALGLDRAPGVHLRRIQPGPLSIGALHHLVRQVTGRTVGRPSLLEIARMSAGNPYFARELATWWSGSSSPATGDPSIPRTMPDSLRGLVDRRIGGLSAATREVVGVAALMARPTRSRLERVTGHDAGMSLAEASASGVLTLDGDLVSFVHPLIAEGAAAVLDRAGRLAAHRALADTATRPEERGRHLAASVSEPDPQIAMVIEDAARSTLEQGAPAAAAYLFTRALELTPEVDRPARARRLTDAAAALSAAGNIRDAEPLARRAAAEASSVGPAARAAAGLVLADIAWAEGRLRDAHDTLLEAARTADDPSLAGGLFARLAGYTLPLDAAEAAEHAKRAAALLRDGGPDGARGYLTINQFLAEVLAGRPARLELLEEGLRLERESAPDRPLSAVPLLWYNAIDDLESARRRHAEEDAEYERRGEEGWRADRQGQLALGVFRAGNWAEARALSDDACARLELDESRAAWWPAWAWRSLIDANLGNVERALATLMPLLDQARAQENEQWRGLLLSAIGVVQFIAGDLRACDAAFVEMRAAFEAIGHIEAIGDRSEPYHVEALLSLGEPARAAEIADHLAARARVLPRPWTRLALPRCRALLAADAGDLEQALDLAGATDPALEGRFPFEAAWNDLVRGRILRRLRRKREAADTLRAALTGFDRLGARPWAERARRELDRVGLRQRPANVLTESEQRIADLAASGLRNREVAAAAFVSEKTVEANLARIYQKLGIRSRAQLGARLADRGASPEP